MTRFRFLLTTAPILAAAVLFVALPASATPPRTSHAVTISPQTLAGGENGVMRTNLVVLTTQPTADVTINIQSNDTTVATVSPASLTFTSTNYGTSQTVTVTAVDDDLDNATARTAAISHTAMSDDPGYDGMGIASMLFTAADDDERGITVTTALNNIIEGTTGTLGFRLNSEPTADVTISFSGIHLSADTITFTPENGTHLCRSP